ncbi:MAG TPA: substrate-binding domain-containing protein [Acetobacteraceae bacterium]|nr:substrate-binding domain-containing protein [Acetobacteraceae bacterium]
MTKQGTLDRRLFGKLMMLAGTAGVAVGGATRAGAAEEPEWKSWVQSYYKKPIKMAVSCAGTSNPYFAPTKAGAEDAGAQLGIDVLWTGVPTGNTVNQISQFEQLINTGYEAVVVISFEPDAWIAPIKRAIAKGVLIVTSNNDSPKSGRELYFGQDLVGAAIVQGKLLAKLAGGKGKVAMTNCAPGSLALDQRLQGARQGATEGGLDYVGVYNTNPADMASEISTMEDILRAHPDLAAMMPLCGPDTAAAGLVRKKQGGKYPVVGTDLLYQTLELIKAGYVDATVGQQPYLQGYLPIMYAYQRVVLGAPRLNLPGGNYYLANEIVTKDNVDQYLIRESRFRG